jgi:branched-chain amino acid transport system ATP-binding protein
MLTSGGVTELLRLTNIDAGYGLVQTLWGVSFAIDRGSIVSLLGSNGAGKSTTARVISGILPVLTGTVLFEDEDITGYSSHRRVELGLVQVPEGRKIFPTLTVLENLELGAYLKKPKAVRKQSLSFVRTKFPILGERIGQRAGTLSGGEQQMLAIGRALMARPRLLVLDEPSLGLAPIIVNEIFEAIEEINREGVTILVIEQNVAQALFISSRAIVLEEGRVALQGNAEEVTNNPRIQALYLGLGEEHIQ